MSLTELRQWAEKLKLEAGNTRRDASRAEYAADKMLGLVAAMEAVPVPTPTPVPVPVPTPTPTPTPPANPVSRAPTSPAIANIGTVYVAPGAQTAVVPIRFSKPLEFMQTCWFQTKNVEAYAADGTKAWEGGTYTAVKRWLMFMPGTTQFDVEVPLKDMRQGWEIAVELINNEDLPQIVNAYGKIRCDTAQAPTVITRAAPIPKPVPPANLGATLFETDFLTGFKVTDNGGPDSFASYHDSQWINTGQAFFAKPGQVPEDLYPVINGVRHIAIAKLATPLTLNLNGQTNSFNYASGMLALKNRFDTPIECYAELRYGWPRDGNGNLLGANGPLPAWWGISLQDPWPPERDRFERKAHRTRLYMTDHWSDLKTGAHRMFRHQPAMDAFGLKHDMAVIKHQVLQTKDWVHTWFNGALADVRPNIHPVKMYEIISMEHGGSAALASGEVISPAIVYPVLMPIHGMKIAALG